MPAINAHWASLDGYKPSSWLTIPSIQLELPVLRVEPFHGVIEQPLGWAALYRDDFGVHNGYSRAAARLRPGAEVDYGSQTFYISKVLVLSKKEAAVFALSHRTLITCTDDWQRNVVYVLEQKISLPHLLAR